MTNVENASVEQVVDTVVNKTKQNKTDTSMFGVFDFVKMDENETKAYLLSDMNNQEGENTLGNQIAKIQNFLPSLIGKVKAIFNPEIQKLKAFLKENQNNTLILGQLKQQIESQQKLNIAFAIQQATNSSAENIQSNPSYANNEYIYPYSLEYYEEMKTAQKLGQQVVKYGPYRQNQENYCGAGVRSILTSYMGFSGFPDRGANGEKRDTILEENYITSQDGKKVEFKKVKVKTPYEAKPGAVIPYEANAELGSSARKNAGHVEIKGADGKYYFDVKGSQPGGSAKVSLDQANAMTAEEYKQKTGFQGYVYYPVLAGELDNVA